MRSTILVDEDPPNPSLLDDSLEHPSNLISSSQTALFLKLTSHFHSHLTSSVLKDKVLFSIPKRRPNVKTGPAARATLELDGVVDGEAVWGVVGAIAEAVGTLVMRSADAFVARGDLKAGFEDEKADEYGDEETDEDVMDVDEDENDESGEEEDGMEVDEDGGLDDGNLDLDGDGDDEDLDLDGDDDLDLDDDDLDRYDTPRTSRKEPTQTSIVDDGFFSLDEFNRFSDRAERYDMMQAKSEDFAPDNEDDDFDEKDLDRDFGAPKGLYESGDEEEMEEDEEEEDDDEDNANDLRYEDFFAPPDERRRRNRENRNKFDNSEPNPNRRVTFDTNDDVREYTPSAPPDALSSEMRDLFSNTNPSSNDLTLSTFERQQRATASAIAELEAEAVAEKPWILRGESSAPNRPRDSLLEVHLDTDVASKPVPVITPTHTASLEELIISRIKANLFDSVERRKPPMDVAYDPDRRIQLDDQKSTKGLAEVYEDAYLAQNSTTQHPGPKSADLEKSHEEIRVLWKEICGPLDALASTHARPRGARVEELEVASIPADTPALENEDVHPTAMSRSAAVAPSEVYSGKTAKASEEMGASEKRTARKRTKHAAGRAKKEKEEDRKAREAWKKGIAPERKENKGEEKRGKREALKGLMKTKGVTVVAEGSMKGEVERASRGGKKGKKGGKHGGSAGGARVVKAGETIGGKEKAAVRAEFLRL
ncbi:Mpp10 protein-domain-containing protein [Cladochytrium replicatum]|nr:Mpp10 protein-domain-containing protein [Cladochytrium replicatum]